MQSKDRCKREHSDERGPRGAPGRALTISLEVEADLSRSDGTKANLPDLPGHTLKVRQTIPYLLSDFYSAWRFATSGQAADSAVFQRDEELLLPGC